MEYALESEIPFDGIKIELLVTQKTVQDSKIVSEGQELVMVQLANTLRVGDTMRIVGKGH